MNRVDQAVRHEIQKTFLRLFGNIPPVLVVQPTNEDFEGTHTLVCFALAHRYKKKPDELATLLGEHLVENVEFFHGYNVVKGFLNLSLASQVWYQAFVSTVHAQTEMISNGQCKEIIVEFSSPNTNKPLHLGHMRNNFLGASISNLYQALGHHVHNVQIINDRGIHICKSMVAWKQQGSGQTPQSAGIKGDKWVGNYYVAFDKTYKAEKKALEEQGYTAEEAEKKNHSMQEAHALLKKWEQKDPDTIALWKRMNSWVYDGFEVTYRRMGVKFDKVYYESDTYLLGRQEVMKGVDQNIFFKKEDGSIWIDLANEKMSEKLLLRSDGTSVYMTQDIGTAILRYHDFPNLSSQVYTVGSEQDHHFKVLFLILKKLGYDWASHCYHLSYGMVDLPSGRMKSREGTVVDADDLMSEMVAKAEEQALSLGKIDTMDSAEAKRLFEMVGIGALKYYLLKVDPKKRFIFNPNESIQLQGHTAPFIQYTYARIRSLLRKQEKNNPQNSTDDSSHPQSELLPSEIQLIQLLLNYPAKVREAIREYSPAIIANYAYELAKHYNHFYQSVSILGEQDRLKKTLRIALSSKISEVIKKTMKLLGIDVPERM